MKKKPELELTKESEYKIYSLSSRNNTMESVGIFKGYTGIGSDEIGFILQLNHTDENNGIMRIIPLHAVLAIDVIKAEPKDTEKEDNEIPHYVG
jgi:hypothetical protein